MPRMPLIEYEEPAESVLTEDTCVTEPVDTAQRERVVRAPQEGCVPGRRERRAETKARTLHWAGPNC